MRSLDELTLVSVDDHLVEPADVFIGRLESRYADRAPAIRRTESGADVWVFGDEVIPNIGLNAVAGRPPDEYGVDPTCFGDMRRGCYEIDDRVRDMDANGVLASLCFPSFPQFCGQLFARCPDKQLALAVLRAYNDWHVEVWAGTHPGRIIPLGLVPLWDADLMADEVRRLEAMGCHAVTFSQNPAKLGLPSLHSDVWDPFWRACDETGTVVCMHLGSNSEFVTTGPDAPIDVSITLNAANLMSAAADLIWSPVLRRYTDLNFALSEGGIGWIPYFLEKIDYVYRHHHQWTNQDFGDRLPSEVFAEHVLACFIDDRVGMSMREHMRADRIMWECDYPHSDSTWPTSPERLAPNLVGLSDEEVDAVTHGNAIRWFKFNAFKHIDPANATVGALRASAGDVVTTLPSTGRRATGDGPVLASAMLAGVDCLGGQR
ncbi:MAG: amidohydrolase family protein [Acidimicrobiia bacterium]